MLTVDNVLARFGYQRPASYYTPLPFDDLDALGYVKATRQFDAPNWLTAGATRWDAPDISLPLSQSSLYQRLSWITIAIGHTSAMASVVPFSVKRRVGEEEKEIINHPFEQLLQRPNPLQSRQELLEATFSYRALTGNAYWWLNRSSENDAPSEVWCIPSNRLKPVPDDRLYLKGYLYEPGNGAKEIPLDVWEVCHFKGFHPFNKYVGMSKTEPLSTVATGDLAMQRWNTNLFNSDNVNFPGILTFSDQIADPVWAQMKTEFQEQAGGTKRKLIMLRATGAKDINWVTTTMTQDEMEFIQGREFNKEEIYAMFAPGLASILAVNATEANARAGKATLMEMGIWPMLVAAAEKVTNDILPVYGENLVGEFEDVRLADRAMDLQEQTAFAQVHTVDEVRSKFYEAPPIGDPRGKLLPAEIGKGLTDGRAPEDKPTPPQLLPFTGAQDERETEGQDDAMQERIQRLQQDKQPRRDDDVKAELETWQRFAANRVKAGKALREFQTNFVPASLKAAIEGALEAVSTVEEVKVVFDDAIAWQGYP